MIRSRVVPALILTTVVFAAAHAVHADVRADQKGLVKFEGVLGRVVNMFGGKAAKEGVKTTDIVKGDRKASLTESGGQIIDLKEEKIYDLDMKKKSYKVTTFAELRKRMEEAQRKAEEDARKEQAKEAKATPPDKNDKNQKEMEVDFSVKETGQKKAINGYDTRQVIITIAIREKGRTLEQNGGLVLTGDSWLGPKIVAMKELADFDMRYAKQLAAPMVAGASAEELAAALAMYPGMKDAMARMRTENVNLDGTPILTTTTIEAVKSAEQMAEEQKAGQGQPASSSGSISGALGGLARRAAPKKEEPKPRATVMTTTSEVLKVTTDVADADVAIPAGFKENK